MAFSSDLLRDPATPATVPRKLAFSLQGSSTKSFTRTLWWPPRAGGTPLAILVFICGNPGIPAWYREFLDAIRDSLSNPSLAILAIGHVGHAHDLPQPSNKISLSLQAQIEAASATRRYLLQVFPNVPHFVIGHSIGAAIAMQTAKDFLDYTPLLIAVQPTLSHMANTTNGRVLKHFFTPWLIPLLAMLGSLLVRVFPSILPLIMSSWPNNATRTLEDFISSSEATKASMTMARDEFMRVTDLDRALLRLVAPKLRVLYSESGDKWVDQNSDEVVQTLGEECAQNIAFAPVPHAFCIEHSLPTAEAVLPWIEEALSALE